MTSATPTDSVPHRRRLIRGFVLLLVAALVVDATPTDALFGARVSTLVDTALRPLGLGTGPWSMFAPNPSVNNCWLTATLEPADGATPTIEWSSPDWRDVGAIEKFYRFRELNYYKSLAQPVNEAGAEDFARHLRRVVPRASEQSRVVLTANGLRYVPPFDGGIPARDEITWMLYSDPLATVEPQR